MRKQKGTLLGQLTAGLSVGILAVVAVFLIVLYKVQTRVLVNNTTGAMGEQCRALRIVLQRASDDAARSAVLDDFFERLLSAGKQVSVAFFSYPGHVLTPHGMGLNPQVPIEFIARAFEAGDNEIRTVTIAGPPKVVAVTLRGYDSTGQRLGLIYYAQLVGPIEGLAVRLLVVEAGMMLVLWALAVVITYFIVRVKVAAPLLHLYVRQHQASRGECRPLKVAEKLGTEIAQLYEGYNEMAARLAKYRASEANADEAADSPGPTLPR